MMSHCNFKGNVKVFATGRYAKFGAQSKMFATSDNTLKSNVTEVLKRKCCRIKQHLRPSMSLKSRMPLVMGSCIT